MKILLKKASDYNYKKIIAMKDLEEVKKFMDKISWPVILYSEKYKDYEIEMCIYDSYIE